MLAQFPLSDQIFADFSAFTQVLLIDIALAGDNVIVIGAAAASVAPETRNRVIATGVTAAILMRIAFAVVAIQLLDVFGLTFLGGILLSWVCWKMYLDLQKSHAETGISSSQEIGLDLDVTGSASGVSLHKVASPGQEIESDLDVKTPASSAVPRKTAFQAIVQVLIADVSMSLDNVLAVAAAARDHPYILVFGLLLSAVLMATVASAVSRLLLRYKWIAWLGLLVIVYVALGMLWRGGLEIACTGFSDVFCSLGGGA